MVEMGRLHEEGYQKGGDGWRMERVGRRQRKVEEYRVQGRAEAWYHLASRNIKGREEEEVPLLAVVPCEPLARLKSAKGIFLFLSVGN